MTKIDYMLMPYLASYFGAVDVAKLEREHEYKSLHGYPNSRGPFVHRYNGLPAISGIDSTPNVDLERRKIIEHDFYLTFSTKQTSFFKILGKLGYNHRSFELKVNLNTFMKFCSSLEDTNVDFNNLIEKGQSPVRVGRYLYNIDSTEKEIVKNCISFLEGKDIAPIEFLVIKGVLSKRSKFYQLVFCVTRIVLFGIVIKGVWDFVEFLLEIIFSADGL